MPHFLQYWKLSQTESEISKGQSLDHSAGEQLNRINVGDVVWIITTRSGILFVIGRMRVGECVRLAEAKKRFGTDVWNAKYHIIAESGTEEDLKTVCIMDIAGKLRFDSPTGKNKLSHFLQYTGKLQND